MSPTAFDLAQDKTYLTVVINGEGHIGSDDVIEANLAVLRGAVGIQGLHAHDSVKQTPFWDRSLIATLNKHRGELIDVVHSYMHGGPEEQRRRQDTRRRGRDGLLYQEEAVIAMQSSQCTARGTSDSDSNYG